MIPKKPDLRIRQCMGVAAVSTVAAFLLIGCAHTQLPAAPFRIEKTSAYPSLDVCISAVPEVLGHQYGLIVFPLGVIDGGDSARARIVSELQVAAAKHGVALHESCSAPQIVVHMQRAAVTVWDLFFVRRVVASLSGTIGPAGGAFPWKFEAESASWRRFGFSAQLDKEFHDVAVRAFDEVPFEKLLTLR